MSSMLGLAELLVVLVGVMGWGAYELWWLRRRRNDPVEPRPAPKRAKGKPRP